MGVRACTRKDCTNIMCDRYSTDYGYICDDCFEELISSLVDIEEFMNTSKKDCHCPNLRNHIDRCEAEFLRSGEGY